LAGTGLATDVLALVEVARRECLAHRYVHEFPLRVGRLVTLLAQDVYDTERHRIVPYALDLLVVGYDRQGGPCLFKVGPAGVIESFRACAVGRRAEQARAYLLARLGEPHATESGAGHPGLRRRMEVRIPAALAAILEDQERRSTDQADGSTPPR
jgi:20S proteasome alpha/beta subunit